MLIGLMFLINILAVGAAFFLRWRGWRTAHIWMILVSVSLIEWLMLTLIRVENIAPLVFSNWFSIGDIPIGIQFNISNSNWPIAFSILTALPALLLTGIARLNVRKDLFFWSSGILFVWISFLALIASDLWSVVILWTVFDLFEIFYHLVIVPTANQTGLQRSLMLRFFGSLFLIYNTALLSRSGINPFVISISGEQSILFLIAAILHSGILPYTQISDNTQATSTERIIHRLVKLLLLTTSFSFLSFFSTPDLLFPINLGLFILIFILLVQFWIQLNSGKIDEFNEKWLIYIAVFVVFLFFNFGNLSFWISSFFFSSLFVILYTHKNKSSIIFPIILLLLISGLPYTLNAFGARAFGDVDFLIPLIVTVVFLAFFLHAFFKAIKQEKNIIDDMEPLYQVVYLTGLLVIVLSIGMIVFKYTAFPQEEISLWWLGVIVILLTGIFIILSERKVLKMTALSKLDRSALMIRILSLDWLFIIGNSVEKRIRALVAGFSNLLEGAGGLLWAIVLLVLILSII